MSRFLRNIIATAQNPGESVHPMMPSLFSNSANQESAAERADDATETLLGREAGAPTAARSTRLDAAPFGAFDADVGRARRETEAARNGIGPQSGPTEKPPTTPIAPVSDAEAGSGNHARDLASAARRFERAPTAAETWDSASGPALRDSSGEDLGPVTEAARTAVSRYSPVVPNAAPSGAIPRALAPLVSPATIQVRRDGENHGNRDLAPHLRSSPREPEEIQIHIGRIEVTAAPPAAARPAAVPNRKSPSLDEYLKRRPGRTR